MSSESKSSTEETGAAHPEGRPAQKFEITVNGRHKTVDDDTLTSTRSWKLAFPWPARPERRLLRDLQPRRFPRRRRANSAKAAVSKVRNGTRFNVTRTVQS